MYDRRMFCLASLSLSACALADLPAIAAQGEVSERRLTKVGIQLYTVREQMKLDPTATMKMLSAVGFREVEFFDVDGLKLPLRDLRKIADDLGLTFPSAMFNPPVFFNEPQKIIDAAGELGCKYVINSWIDEKDRTPSGYRAQAESFNKLGAEFMKAQLRFAFHNHAFEFAKMVGNKTGYDLLVQNTDPALVDFELDMFWVVEGQASIKDLLTRYGERFKCVHVKDRTAAGKMVNVGEGAIDWKMAIGMAVDSGAEHFFVEHDQPSAPVTAALGKSFRFLRELRF